MTDPTIRDEVLAAWRRILTRAGAQPATVDALALELEQAAEGHGARLPRRPRPEDPNTAATLPPPTAVRRAHDAADYQAARAALRPRTALTVPTTTPAIPDWPDRIEAAIEAAHQHLEIARTAMQDDEADA